MTGLHAAVVNAGRASGWALMTPGVARRTIPRSDLTAYVYDSGTEVVVRWSWFVARYGRPIQTGTAVYPADALGAADTAMTDQLRVTVARRSWTGRAPREVTP